MVALSCKPLARRLIVRVPPTTNCQQAGSSVAASEARSQLQDVDPVGEAERAHAAWLRRLLAVRAIGGRCRPFPPLAGVS